MKHIILIGFMGSGKSTYGKLIANKLGYSFVDTDSFIERKEGRSISDIFADDGEDYFRSLETEVLKELMQVQKPQVHTLVLTIEEDLLQQFSKVHRTKA